ncbi:chemotaxis protein CheW [Fulvivirga maritima]|uniref:chemotaxis protein CheW n=1 Tax=Fulvivirga maritima TaxID=2904247 RepID=UPI001F469F4A|nr:chemotaxis protein CheW [Fulvivirga maritima]UII25287.1 chemotaxis protein CheW [Fulvivirga maritima]
MQSLQEDKSTKKNAQPKEKEAEQKGKALQIVVFKQGNEEFAMHIDQIKEVVITPSITRMPQTPDFVLGVANIRGNIIAILDLEKKFGFKKDPNETLGGKNFTLVIESEEFKMGVLVKDVPNTLTVYENEIEESLNVIHDSSMEQNYIKGIVKREERLIIMIDTLKIVTESEMNAVAQSVV